MLGLSRAAKVFYHANSSIRALWLGGVRDVIAQSIACNGRTDLPMDCTMDVKIASRFQLAAETIEPWLLQLMNLVFRWRMLPELKRSVHAKARQDCDNRWDGFNLESCQRSVPTVFNLHNQISRRRTLISQIYQNVTFLSSPRTLKRKHPNYLIMKTSQFHRHVLVIQTRGVVRHQMLGKFSSQVRLSQLGRLTY